MSAAEVMRRWREWQWNCSPCADLGEIASGRLVHQGPYVDRCHICGDETRYLLEPLREAALAAPPRDGRSST